MLDYAVKAEKQQLTVVGIAVHTCVLSGEQVEQVEVAQDEMTDNVGRQRTAIINQPYVTHCDGDKKGNGI